MIKLESRPTITSFIADFNGHYVCQLCGGTSTTTTETIAIICRNSAANRGAGLQCGTCKRQGPVRFVRHDDPPFSYWKK